MSSDLLDSLLLGGRLPTSVRGSTLPRVREGAFPTELEVDQHGYPSDAKVEEISLVAGVRCREWLHDVLPEVWKTIGCYGTVQVKDGTEDREIYLATGGWSGCESVIHAVLGNLFMRNYCTTRSAGGGYTFIVPHE